MKLCAQLSRFCCLSVQLTKFLTFVYNILCLPQKQRQQSKHSNNKKMCRLSGSNPGLSDSALIMLPTMPLLFTYFKEANNVYKLQIFLCRWCDGSHPLPSSKMTPDSRLQPQNPDVTLPAAAQALCNSDLKINESCPNTQGLYQGGVEDKVGEGGT